MTKETKALEAPKVPKLINRMALTGLVLCIVMVIIVLSTPEGVEPKPNLAVSTIAILLPILIFPWFFCHLWKRLSESHDALRGISNPESKAEWLRDRAQTEEQWEHWNKVMKATKAAQRIKRLKEK